MSSRRSRISARPNLAARSAANANSKGNSDKDQNSNATKEIDKNSGKDTDQSHDTSAPSVEKNDAASTDQSAVKAVARRPRFQAKPALNRKPKPSPQDSQAILQEAGDQIDGSLSKSSQQNLAHSTSDVVLASSECNITSEKDARSNVSVVLDAQSSASSVPDTQTSTPLVLVNQTSVSLAAKNQIDTPVNDTQTSSLLISDTQSTDVPAIAVTSPLKHRSRMKAKPNVIEAGRARMRRLSESLDHSPSVAPARRNRHNSSSLGGSNSSVLVTPISIKQSNESTTPDGLQQGTSRVNDSPDADSVAKSIMNDEMEHDESSNLDKAVAKRPRRKRRRVIHSDQAPDTSKMTLKELIYYQPTSNPMPGSEVTEQTDRTTPVSSRTPTPTMGEETTPANTQPSIAPQIMIGDDGQIVVNENSLIIDNPPEKTPVYNDVVHVDSHGEGATYASFRKTTQTKFWTVKDTHNFYKALNAVGTDFSLMSELFPHRTRAELKNKFKREEKVNPAKVELALKGSLRFDAEPFQVESDDPQTTKKRKRASKPRKTGRGGHRRTRTYYDDSEDDRESGNENEADNAADTVVSSEVIVYSEQVAPAVSNSETSSSNQSEHSHNHNDDVTEVEIIDSIQAKPTRSGRQPKKSSAVLAASEQSQNRLVHGDGQTTPVHLITFITPPRRPPASINSSSTSLSKDGISSTAKQVTPSNSELFIIPKERGPWSKPQIRFIDYLCTPPRRSASEVTVNHSATASNSGNTPACTPMMNALPDISDLVNRSKFMQLPKGSLSVHSIDSQRSQTTREEGLTVSN